MGYLSKRIWDILQKVVEIKLPILIFIFNSILQDTLVVVTCHKDISIFKNCHGLDHGGQRIKTLADGHLSLRDLIMPEL